MIDPVDHAAQLCTVLVDLVDAWRQITPVPGRGATMRITGTPDKNLGVNIAALDQLMPPQPDAVHDPYGDQTGAQSVATILDAWVKDWAYARREHGYLPLPTVPYLAGWLQARTPWATQHHPAIDDYEREICAALRTCQAIIGDRPDEPSPYFGESCPNCDKRALWSIRGVIKCAGCGWSYIADRM